VQAVNGNRNDPWIAAVQPLQVSFAAVYRKNNSPDFAREPDRIISMWFHCGPEAFLNGHYLVVRSANCLSAARTAYGSASARWGPSCGRTVVARDMKGFAFLAFLYPNLSPLSRNIYRPSLFGLFDP
jgi:hypothetical protein